MSSVQIFLLWSYFAQLLQPYPRAQIFCKRIGHDSMSGKSWFVFHMLYSKIMVGYIIMPRSQLDIYDQHLCILVFIPLFCPLVGLVEQNRDCIGFLDYLFFTRYSQRDLISKKCVCPGVCIYEWLQTSYICIAFASIAPSILCFLNIIILVY